MGATLRNATFHEADLRQARLGRVDLTGADLRRANLTRADATDVRLDGADLGSSQVVHADLSRAQLSNTSLNNADLSDALLVEANLERVSGKHVRLSNARLDGARLVNASLDNADLRSASLYRADLTDAALPKARLTDADLSWARLIRTDLRGAVVDGVLVDSIHIYALAGHPQPPDRVRLDKDGTMLEDDEARGFFSKPATVAIVLEREMSHDALAMYHCYVGACVKDDKWPSDLAFVGGHVEEGAAFLKFQAPSTQLVYDHLSLILRPFPKSRGINLTRLPKYAGPSAVERDRERALAPGSLHDKMAAELGKFEGYGNNKPCRIKVGSTEIELPYDLAKLEELGNIVIFAPVIRISEGDQVHGDHAQIQKDVSLDKVVANLMKIRELLADEHEGCAEFENARKDLEATIRAASESCADPKRVRNTWDTAKSWIDTALSTGTWAAEKAEQLRDVVGRVGDLIRSIAG